MNEVNRCKNELSLVKDEELLQKIKKFNVVSFDLFDTLIFRTVKAPEDIFDLVEMVYNSQSTYRKLRNYRNVRIRCEGKARREKYDHEIQFNDIFKYMPYPQEVIDQLKCIEKQIEIKNCLPNTQMVSIANDAYREGKTVLVTTDIYLDRDTISQILEKVHVSYTYLFISSEEGETKGTGKLFKIICNRLDTAPSKILHIGDNESVDINKAREQKMNAEKCIDLRTWMAAYSNNRGWRSGIGINQLKTFLVDKNIPYNDSPDYVMGYSILGPYIYAFCKWIKSQQLENHLQKLIFVSREGYLLKNAYLTLYPEDKSIVSYACLNKNVLRFPALAVLPSVNTFRKTIISRSDIFLFEVFRYFRIDDNDPTIAEICQKYHVDIHQKYRTSELGDETFRKIFGTILEYKWPDIQQQLDFFVQYVNELNIPNNKIGLINNSLFGNGQSLLKDILERVGINSDIIGLQFVAFKSCLNKVGKEKVKTWIPHDRLIDKYLSTKSSGYCTLFEHLFFEPIGTARYLEKENNGIIGVVHNDVRLQKENFEKVGQVQKYICKFCSEFDQVACLTDFSLFYRVPEDLYFSPRYDDARYISGLYDDDDVQKSKKLVMPETERIDHFLDMVKAAKKKAWKQGYIKISKYPDSFLSRYNRVQSIVDIKRMFDTWL